MAMGMIDMPVANVCLPPTLGWIWMCWNWPDVGSMVYIVGRAVVERRRLPWGVSVIAAVGSCCDAAT